MSGLHAASTRVVISSQLRAAFVSERIINGAVEPIDAGVDVAFDGAVDMSATLVVDSEALRSQDGKSRLTSSFPR